MNITRYNFQSMLPFIEQCLSKSRFVAFDFEMTGLSFQANLKNSNTDTVTRPY